MNEFNQGSSKKIALLGAAIVGLLIVAFAFKSYSVNLQKEKELTVIEAQRQKELSIIQEKSSVEEKQKMVRDVALQSCLQTAQNNLQSSYQTLLAVYGLSSFNELQTYCDTKYAGYPVYASGRVRCYEAVTKQTNDITAKKKADEDDCYKRFPQ